GATLVNHAGTVAHEYTLTSHTEAHVVLGGGDGGRARAGEHDGHVLDRFPDDLQRVEQRRTGDDRRPVLIVMKHWNPHRFAECFLDVEAIGGADVLEVDAADRWFEELAELDD